MRDLFFEIPIVSAPNSLLKKYKQFLSADLSLANNLVKRKLNSQTIIHVNSTSCGGGVAEILKSQIAIEKSLGLDSHWLVISAPPKFFNITKKIHNLIQGAPGNLTKGEKDFYLKINREIGKPFRAYCEKFKKPIIVIHDPQPMPLIEFVPKDAKCISRLHIDLSTPNLKIMDFLSSFIKKYSLVIVSSPTYIKAIPWPGRPWIKKSKIIMPAIDPFTEKNIKMKKDVAKSVIQELGINPTKPIISQISRFDSWKNPLGVIKAYYLAKNKIPELQLVLAGFFQAKDDPEAISMFKTVKKHAAGDNDIHLFSELDQIRDISNDVFINALYTASSIVIQNSFREGFGLTMTEAMWKAKPLIAKKSTGALLQIKNKYNGILISSSEEIANWVAYLLKNKKYATRLGLNARNSVKKNFLLLHFVLNNLKCYSSLV